MLISLIVPCYNEEESLTHFHEECERVLSEIKKEYDVDGEYIFIDDGSKDKTLSILRDLHQKDEKVHYVSFSRNFGKEAGIYAGLKHAKGDYIVPMDADLQHPPVLVKDMLATLLTEDYDSVCARRVSRKGESKIRSWFSNKFYSILNKHSDTKVESGSTDFRLMKRKMVDAVLSMSEVNRFSKGLFSWVGFKTKWLEYENVERYAGTTKWSFWSLAKYAIEGIVSFSTSPLRIASMGGFLLAMISVIWIIIIVIKKLTVGDPVAGWPSLACIILFCSSIQLICIGIMGEYISKIYLEVKERPIYIVAETDNDMKKK